MENDRSSKIRALALAGRCLSREMERLLHKQDAEDDHGSAFERERVIRLARTILDPTYAPDGPKPAAKPKPGERNAPANGRAPGDAEVALIDLLGDGPPSPKHTLSLLGHGSRVAIPELVGFLGGISVDGILKVTTERELFMVEFDAGHISHGEASHAPEGQRLGDILVSQGAIDREVLEGICLDGMTWKLGRKLLDEDLITKEQLIHALEAQIQMLFCRLFHEPAKGFTFWAGPPLCGEAGVRLNSTSLLLEGARAKDEVDDAWRSLEGIELPQED